MAGIENTPLTARRRVFGYGAAVLVAIAVSALVMTLPLSSQHSESLQVGADGLALRRVTDLRTTMAAWQVYLEPHFAVLSTAASPVDPIELGKGATLAQAQNTEVRDAVSALKALGIDRTAADIETASAAFVKTLAPLAPLANGRPIAEINAAVAAERAAYQLVADATSTATAQLRDNGVRDLQQSIDHLNNGRRIALAVGSTAAALVLGATLVLGQRARRKEVTEHTSEQRRMFETTMQHALEMARAEPDVYSVLSQALDVSVPSLQVEMLVADSSRAHFHQTFTTNTDGVTEPRSGCGVVSPLDCPATRRGHTLVFPSSRALDACPYLKGRASGECSAACVAISLTGKTVGVLHATGPDLVPPTETEVRYLEITSRRASERIAMLRAFEKSEAQARSDPLTGLWNRRSLENRVHDLQREGTPYALAYGDLDHFKVLNDTHGHEAGDQALRLFSRVLRDAIRPDDIAARYGGEEFVIVLPDCDTKSATKILERLREQLALTLTTGRVPTFTVSFGLASSVDADTFDEIVACADQALLAAKTEGRNRTVVASRLAVPAPPTRQA